LQIITISNERNLGSKTQFTMSSDNKEELINAIDEWRWNSYGYSPSNHGIIEEISVYSALCTVYNSCD